jgi:hypothetical protein
MNEGKKNSFGSKSTAPLIEAEIILNDKVIGYEVLIDIEKDKTVLLIERKSFTAYFDQSDLPPTLRNSNPPENAFPVDQIIPFEVAWRQFLAHDRMMDNN